METCFEDLFSLYRMTANSLWLPQMQGVATENSDLLAYQLLFGARTPNVVPPSSLGRQQQPMASTGCPAIEDEETRHAAPSDVGGGAPPADSQVRATVSIFREPIPGGDASPSASPPRKASADTCSDSSTPQAETSFKNTTNYGTQPFAFPSTSSFNPYDEQGSHPAYGFSMRPDSTSDNVIGAVPHSSSDSEQPTDLSLPKGIHDTANNTDSETDESDDSDDDGDITERPPKQAQPGSPIRYPTYTHLSDVSNDSVDDDGGNKQPIGPYPNARTGPQMQNDFVPHLPQISYLYVKDPPSTNERTNIVTLEQLVDYFIKLMSFSVSAEKLSSLLSQWQDRLNGNTLNFRTGKAVIRQLDDSDDEDNEQQSGTQQSGNVAGGRGQPGTGATTREEQEAEMQQEEDVAGGSGQSGIRAATQNEQQSGIQQHGDVAGSSGQSGARAEVRNEQHAGMQQQENVAGGSGQSGTVAATLNEQQSGIQLHGNVARGSGRARIRAAMRNRVLHKNTNEVCELIDLTVDNDESDSDTAQEEMQQESSPPEEQECQQDSVAQPHIELMQPGEPRAMYSLPDKPPPMGAEHFTPAVQLSPTPAQEFVSPSQLNEADIQSAAISEEPIVAPAPQSPMNPSSPPPFAFLAAPAHNCAAEEPFENRPMSVVPPEEPELSAELSSPPHDYPMEPLIVAEAPMLFPAPVPEEPSPVPGTSQSVVALSPWQLPTQQDAGGEHSGTSERRSREPWDHKGLVSFVARHAFTLPRHVWAERKEGQPRRSMRIAKKKPVKIYFLRERHSSKSAPDKRNG